MTAILFRTDLLQPLVQGLLLVDCLESEALRAYHVDGVDTVTETCAGQVLGSVSDLGQ